MLLPPDAAAVVDGQRPVVLEVHAEDVEPRPSVAGVRPVATSTRSTSTVAPPDGRGERSVVTVQGGVCGRGPSAGSRRACARATALRRTALLGMHAG